MCPTYILTNVSKERTTFVFRIEALISNRFLVIDLNTLRSSETSVNYKTIWSHIPDDRAIHSHSCENLKSDMRTHYYIRPCLINAKKQDGLSTIQLTSWTTHFCTQCRREIKPMQEWRTGVWSRAKCKTDQETPAKYEMLALSSFTPPRVRLQTNKSGES
jgi:ribosomal protein L37AE/L43A